MASGYPGYHQPPPPGPPGPPGQQAQQANGPFGGSRPGPPPPAGTGFGPPPPAGGGQQFQGHPGGGGFGPPPPGPPPPGPPPPGQMGGAPPHMMGGGGGGGMPSLSNSMGGMSMGGPPPAMMGAPPPPGAMPGQQPPGQMFAPPPPGGMPGQQPPGQMFAPPPPGAGQHQPPAPQHQQMNLSQPGTSSFYNQAPTQNEIGRIPNPTARQGQQPSMAQPQQSFQESVDLSIQAPKRILRFTTSAIPSSASLSTSIKIPFGAVLRPLAPPSQNEEEIDVINPGAAGIVRCKRCRTYMNAFITWLENGRRYRCNICAQLNECPSAYFCHLDETGQRRDRLQRPELCKSVVEFVAPSEYMVRPPQPPSYFFLLDVSATAVKSGMLKSAAMGILESLDDLPGKNRTQVGFITFDNSVHYYMFKSGMSHPQMMVVADLNELFVPAPDDLLVNLCDCRDVVEDFLTNLPSMFAKTTVQEACLGPALKAAFTVTKHLGGKMSVFLTMLPSLGDGKLKPRENFRVMGTPEEMKLLKPEATWYKDTAIEFSRAQISVDMYLFPYAYIDTSSLSELPKLTAGVLKTYAGFDSNVDGARFESELVRSLTQSTAFESVMRIRCTKGMKISNFYGNFYIRGTDLLALPNCTADSTFAFDLGYDGLSNATVVTVQGALLYTSSDGERRIRVVTQAVPLTSLMMEVVGSADSEVICNLLAKQALTMAFKSTLDNARQRLQQICLEIIRMAKGGEKRNNMGYPAQHAPQGGNAEEERIPENLQLLPLYIMSLIKNVAFRGGTDVHPDERIQAYQLLMNMWVSDSTHFMYPRMFSIHDMHDQCGLTSDDSTDEGSFAGKNKILLPKVVNLSVERLTTEGMFLLDNGVDMMLWVGRGVDVNLAMSLFGVESFDGLDVTKMKPVESGNDVASRFHAITTALRDGKQTKPKVVIVPEGHPQKEQRFFWHLVEDSASFQGGTYSYPQFMQMVNSKGGSAAPPMPPGAPAGRQSMQPPPPQLSHGPGHPPNMPPPPQMQGHQGPPPNQMQGHQGPPPNQMAPNRGPPNQGPPPHQMAPHQGPPPPQWGGTPNLPPAQTGSSQPPPQRPPGGPISMPPPPQHNMPPAPSLPPRANSLNNTASNAPPAMHNSSPMPPPQQNNMGPPPMRASSMTVPPTHNNNTAPSPMHASPPMAPPQRNTMAPSQMHAPPAMGAAPHSANRSVMSSPPGGNRPGMPPPPAPSTAPPMSFMPQPPNSSGRSPYGPPSSAPAPPIPYGQPQTSAQSSGAPPPPPAPYSYGGNQPPAGAGPPPYSYR